MLAKQGWGLGRGHRVQIPATGAEFWGSNTQQADAGGSVVLLCGTTTGWYYME